MDLPRISIVIPTYNSERTLTQCLESVRQQDYPRDKIEIIIVDGGSSDKTVEIGKKFNVDKVLQNKRRHFIYGKSIGVDSAEHPLTLLLDSDNILPLKSWLRDMVKPFEDPEIVGSEPISFTYRQTDPLVTRYCALMGVSDPLCLYLGNFDHICLFKEKWTDLPLKTISRDSYIKIELDGIHTPTLGANGTILYTELIKKTAHYKPFFDVDLIHELAGKGYNRFAKVHIGIVHLYAENLTQFVRKKLRQARDFYLYRHLRNYPGYKQQIKLLSFILATITIVGTARDSNRGYQKVPDKAWFLHPIICLLTLMVYGTMATWKALAR